MNFNIILLVLGIIVVTISLYITVKKEDNIHNQDIHSMYIEKEDKLNNKLNFEIDSIREDILKMQHQFTDAITSLEKLVEQNDNKYNPVNTSPEYIEGKSFKNVLNYNKFIKKNKDIISMYNEGKKSNEIAACLSKSQREVEMVLRLIK
ncbi:hypothetical protein RH915_01915 [Serpentinicella sp. ANB-PHB4]|uniref:DUF6115 domain-containing protein n=1 Tax=Serpentinicella sp. ANB-PHB4 TaxID=3074076 RepID=UPI0028609B62|nr:hypothetical protein [Serpentinicella sp. ANB-PHB4]MDR5658238.1 hypothetical protein [Serpentinicella sp. ANB-PHB4]